MKMNYSYFDLHFAVEKSLTPLEIIDSLKELKQIIYDKRQTEKFDEWEDEFALKIFKNGKMSTKYFSDFETLSNQKLEIVDGFCGIGTSGTDFTTLHDRQVLSSLRFYKTKNPECNLSAIRTVIDSRLLRKVEIQTQKKLIDFGTNFFVKYGGVSGYIDLAPFADPLPFGQSNYEICQRLQIDEDIKYFQRYVRGYTWANWLSPLHVKYLPKAEKSLSNLKIFNIQELGLHGVLLQLTEDFYDVGKNELDVMKDFLSNILKIQTNKNIPIFNDERLAV